MLCFPWLSLFCPLPCLFPFPVGKVPYSIRCSIIVCKNFKKTIFHSFIHSIRNYIMQGWLRKNCACCSLALTILNLRWLSQGISRAITIVLILSDPQDFISDTNIQFINFCQLFHLRWNEETQGRNSRQLSVSCILIGLRLFWIIEQRSWQISTSLLSVFHMNFWRNTHRNGLLFYSVHAISIDLSKQRNRLIFCWFYLIIDDLL